MAKSSQSFGGADASFDLAEDREFQRAFWSVQRGAWLIFALILVLGLLGLTGSGGWFSRTSISTVHAEIHVPRIGRWQTGDAMEIESKVAGALVVELRHNFLDLYQLGVVTPEPEAVVAGPSGVAFTFLVEPRSAARFELEPRHPIFRGEADVVVNGRIARLRPVILP
jgi:hypothetical protein